MVQSWEKQHPFTEIIYLIFLPVVSYMISWFYLELQVKESNGTRTFNNRNLVNLATQKYLK